MTKSADRYAFLITSNDFTSQTISLYHLIKNTNCGDVFLLYHNTSEAIPEKLAGLQIEIFTDELLHSLGYKPLKKTILPGSNHFPVLNFFLNHPGYSHYWCIENDVAFNGNWQDLFNKVSVGQDYDFISSHIRKHRDTSNWFWWNTFNTPEGLVNKDDLYSSFNPIYRISNRALKYIDTCLKNAYAGHHEVLLPTLLKKAGFSLADFGTEDNCLTPALSFCTVRTMRWKPVFFTTGTKKNKLYHPVKTRITFKQVLVYIKRTLLSKKRYIAD